MKWNRSWKERNRSDLLQNRSVKKWKRLWKLGNRLWMERDRQGARWEGSVINRHRERDDDSAYRTGQDADIKIAKRIAQDWKD